MVEDVAATERRTRADDSEVVQLALGSELGVVSDDRANDVDPAPTVARAPTTDVLDDATLREARACSEHGEAPEARPGLDDGARADVDRRNEPRAGSTSAVASTRVKSAPSASPTSVRNERSRTSRCACRYDSGVPTSSQ